MDYSELGNETQPPQAVIVTQAPYYTQNTSLSLNHTRLPLGPVRPVSASPCAASAAF